MKWRSCSPTQCNWVTFENDFVVYHRPSGKTHFLNVGSEVLLTDVLTEARSLTSILDIFASDDTDEDHEEYVRQMQSMLDRLEYLGLIERV